MATKTLGSEPVAALSRRPVSLVSPATAARATSVTATEAKAAVANIFVPWRGSALPSAAPVPVTAVPLFCSTGGIAAIAGVARPPVLRKRLEKERGGAVAEKDLLSKWFCWKDVSCDDERLKHSIRLLHIATPAGTPLPPFRGGKLTPRHSISPTAPGLPAVAKDCSARSHARCGAFSQGCRLGVGLSTLPTRCMVKILMASRSHTRARRLQRCY